MSTNEQQIAQDYAQAVGEAASVAEAKALYWDGLSTYGPDGMDWSQVNAAILRRWSRSTLEKIKRHAWKMCGETKP